MSLTQLLKERIENSSKSIPENKQMIMKSAIDELIQSRMIDNALKTGDQIPEITLPNVHNNNISVQQLLKKSKVILTFYRGGWCPYCNLELKALQNHLEDFKNLNATLIAISPEAPDNALTTSEKNQLQFEILQDTENQVANQFGILFNLPSELVEIYKSFKIDVAKSNHSSKHELPIAATYIIDKGGKIIYDYLEEDYKKRADPLDLIEFLKKNK